MPNSRQLDDIECETAELTSPLDRVIGIVTDVGVDANGFTWVTYKPLEPIDHLCKVEIALPKKRRLGSGKEAAGGAAE